MIARFLPFLEWFKGYTIHHFRLDFVSGITVALVLVPQSMAYAQLAGLPAYYGLYAAFLPPLVASLFGSSRQLATGPVAVVSLMTATALEPLATAGSEMFVAYAILLALLVGLFQLLLGVLRLGLVVNFLSHPVVNGFTNAAALIIASSQLAKIFGVNVVQAEHQYETVYNIFRAAWYFTHWPTLGLAILAFIIMYAIRRINPRLPYVLVAVGVTTIISWATGFEHNCAMKLNQIKSHEAVRTINQFNETVDRIQELVDQRIQLGADMKKAVGVYGENSLAAASVHNELSLLNIEIEELKERNQLLKQQLWMIHLKSTGTHDGAMEFYDLQTNIAGMQYDQYNWRLLVGNRRIDSAAVRMACGGSVVGNIPRGLPSLIFPKFDTSVAFNLLPIAIIISLLGFMEAISIAKAMAARTGQRLDPNQELIGQGMSNIVGSFFQSYAVSGSFSRSAVNIQSGAVSGLSNVVSSLVVVIVLIFLTPLLYYLPQAVLAAIIMMAVIGLLNVKGFIHSWKAQKYDGIIGLITFVLTLGFAPHLEWGIMVGVILSLGLYMLRNMKPDIALLAKHPDGTWRNSERFGLARCKHLAVVRYNGSLFFANTNYLEDKILELVSSMPHLKQVIIVGNGINELDASGEDILSLLADRLRENGLGVSVTGLNDSVLDVMRRTHLYEKIGENQLFRNVARAIDALHREAHIGSDEAPCPLLEVVYLDGDSGGKPRW
ncbi:MAG: sodium-independent anion transporter [candidate division Zixibacteria bacterium HGW-Zixibacteria-1]|nr:MAG: sodium-independent anion transporter [candidate division Zixibacteria bacterium HGW-Zixibacteria-1]